MFHALKPFNRQNVNRAPIGPGVYIIYTSGEPIYVGRSRRDIRGRLRKHVTKTGSQIVAEAITRNVPLEFECQEMMSVEQAEAQLIRSLGTYRYGNLRRETDPADR